MMIAIYRLFRVPNLIMIALTQYLVFYCLIKPNITLGDGLHFMSNLNFGLLILSTVFIAVAGYIINDYFDLKADWINKPDKMSIGRKIPRRTAIILHWFFNILGVLIGLYLGWKMHMWKLGLLNFIVSVSLWFYSTNFKRQFLTGNLLISILTAFVILIVWIFQFFAVNTDLYTIRQMLHLFTVLIFPYAVFAFLLSFVRELVKDVEDIEGDKRIACMTFPIVYGIKKTRILIMSFLALTVIILTYVLFRLYDKSLYFVFWYTLITVEIPLIYMLYRVNSSETKEHFAYLSLLTKIIMFAGILTMQVFYL